jgi:alkylhydroperoxidase family enzyme
MSDPRGVRVPVGADGRPVGRDAELVSLLASYQDAVVRSSLLDTVTTELIRLRCARQHDCRICQTLRLSDAARDGLDDAMSDEIDFYETSSLSERHKVALRIVDAFIWRPSDIDDLLVSQAHANFSDDEISEILIDITKWSTQKIHVCLGTDGADRLPVNDRGVSYFSFDGEGRVEAITAEMDA